MPLKDTTRFGDVHRRTHDVKIATDCGHRSGGRIYSFVRTQGCMTTSAIDHNTIRRVFESFTSTEKRVNIKQFFFRCIYRTYCVEPKNTTTATAASFPDFTMPSANMPETRTNRVLASNVSSLHIQKHQYAPYVSLPLKIITGAAANATTPPATTTRLWPAFLFLLLFIAVREQDTGTRPSLHS